MKPEKEGYAISAQGRLVPALVVIACILPQFAPGSAPADLSTMLTAGSIQSLSQILFLIVIIGLSGGFPEFGTVRPRPRDAAHAAGLLIGLLALGKLAALAATALVLPGTDSGTVAPPIDPGTVPRMAALSLIFSLAVGYREELLYRAYAIRSLRRMGASPAIAGLISVILFTAGHAYQGPAGIFSSALLGTALAAAFLRGANLHALAWAHAGYDLTLLLAGIGLSA